IRCGRPSRPLVAQTTVRSSSRKARTSSSVILIWSRRLTRGTLLNRQVRRAPSWQAATVPDHEATHLLPPHAASIVLSRRAVEALPLGAARTGEVKLIVSELVTNSIEHGDLGAHDRIELHAVVDGSGALHMDVRD